jgi:hypothetical protein
MCRTSSTCEPTDVVMGRVAAEIRSTADDLALIEADVAGLLAGKASPDGILRLQSLDRLGQQLRTLELFLTTAAPCQCGRLDIDPALDRVWLESVRTRLGGGRTPGAEAAATEPELW